MLNENVRSHNFSSFYNFFLRVYTSIIILYVDSSFSFVHITCPTFLCNWYIFNDSIRIKSKLFIARITKILDTIYHYGALFCYISME